MEDLFPVIPEDLAALSVEELEEYIASAREAVASVTTDPAAHVSAELSSADLISGVRATTESIKAARAELASREPVEDEPVALTDEETAELADLRLAAEETDEEDEDEEPEALAVEEEVVEEPEPVVASAAKRAPATKKRLPVPGKDRRALETHDERVTLTAAAGIPGVEPGQEFPSMELIAGAMQERRRHFGIIAEGTSGERVPVARGDWRGLYPEERKLGGDAQENEGLIAAATNGETAKKELDRRRSESLTASGGLCAPVTPYYGLAMVSVGDRPVRAALPAFQADRGGIRYAQPPALLGDITDAVGIMTADDDKVGGTTATKTCQVVDCPPFQETDVAAIFHCLQFGNLGARTFPERVTQWTNLTLAAHARLAESALLTGIDTASTQVTASDLGLGASSTLFSQIMTAAAGMRSRHRMAGDTVLRVMLPWWSVYLIVSDVFRGQFGRFEVDKAKVVQLLRSIDVEPSFYIDGASGRSQVYGTQGDGKLLPFPSDVVFYIYPEGSFLYLDGGTLELGLVRDSVLNATNDFQIFGETFENVAYIGVESLAVVSTTCDSGTVSLPDSVTCPIDYA